MASPRSRAGPERFHNVAGYTVVRSDGAVGDGEGGEAGEGGQGEEGGTIWAEERASAFPFAEQERIARPRKA